MIKYISNIYRLPRRKTNTEEFRKEPEQTGGVCEDFSGAILYKTFPRTSVTSNQAEIRVIHTHAIVRKVHTISRCTPYKKKRQERNRLRCR